MNTNPVWLASVVIAVAGCTCEEEEPPAPTEEEVVEEEVAQDSEPEVVSTLEEFFVEEGGVIVTPETYPIHETARQMLKNQDLAGINELLHKRALTPTDDQPVVRMNRDTYYSLAVVDVSEGASITMPEVPEGTYMSVQPVTEDHRIQSMRYGAGTFELSTHVGRYLCLVIRLDSRLSPGEAAATQDQMSISAGATERFSAVPVDRASFDEVETALKAQMPAIAERDGVEALFGMFTDPGDESAELFLEEKYRVGAAVGWGGAQLVDNIYELSGNYPAETCHQATFEDPMNAAFWSVTVYNRDGFMFNDHASLNSHTATANDDDTFTISFGCGEDAPNNIETANESGVFNLGFRHYRPSDRVREGYRLLPSVTAVASEE